MKTIGIAMHSAEGGVLSLLTACREGAAALGEHMHPTIVTSILPMALSMPGWESGDHTDVAKHLGEGIERVAAAGADFWICPDNTAHIVLERIAAEMPIPGLHIAEVVCGEIVRSGWKRAGVLGTKWTMTGPVYEEALARAGVERLVPDEPTREKLNGAIFDELCNGIFEERTVALFVGAIEDLKSRGADCVILGCTEIPLIITERNSPLPPLDSTRLLAKYAVGEAIDPRPLPRGGGWISRSSV
jgi:aspartate racemase